MNLRSLIVILTCCLVSANAQAASWWNGDWKFRKEIILDSSPTGADFAGTAQDVPLLVRLSLANFNYFSDVKPDGSDFRAIDGDDKTPLKFHIERFDAQNQMAFIWIQVPRVTGGAKTDKIYLYYGNPSAAAASDVPGSFDVNQTLALHFAEATGLPLDGTAYKNNPSAATSTFNAASLIAGGQKFVGGQAITVPATPSLRFLPNQGITLSAWVKLDGPQAQAYVMALADGAKEIALGVDGNHAFASATGAARIAQSTSELSLGDWHHLALTVGNNEMTLYVDGVSAGKAPAQLAEIGGTLSIGASARNSNFLKGEIDEAGAAKVARSPDWIKAVGRSQGTTAPLVTYGADGQKEGGQNSYFTTIAKNLTVDGWVVILICFSMLIIAIIIMIFKAVFLSRVERGNDKFLSDYHNMDNSADAGALTKGTYGASTLHQLYTMGIDEMHKRFGGAASTSVRSLSPQMVEAIRASMDATSTRLGQKLSARMVLLTIAISGGPFLGLLGTVIGVMITFAAIALSGDVNVNAIAPGTAAALAATVAGLSVAIPCLFGYNWLNTRIKSISANNRVFLDEFVARLAERYS